MLDIETTGLDMYKDQIIEIGIVFLSGYSEIQTEHRYFNPTVKINPAAEKVHGLSKEFLSKYTIFDPAWLISIMQSYPLIIHNANFDFNFINCELKRLNYPILTNQVIDTLKIARTKFPGAPANLNALCSRFKIENKHRKLHGALIDALLTAKVYSKLTNYGAKALLFGEIKTEKKITNDIRVHVSTEEKTKYLEFLMAIHNF